MRRNALLWTSLLFATVLAGCRPNTVKMLYVPDERKVVLHPEMGTVIQWTAASGVSFPFGNPCKEPAPQEQCTINVTSARVPYVCDNCADPEIVVGSGISPQSPGPQAVAAAVAPTATVYMGCNSNQVAIYPITVTIKKAALPAGASVLWVPGGLTPVGSDWAVNNFTSPICSNAPPFNSGNNTCNLKTDLAAGSTTYTVAAASCNNTSTTGTITITP